MPTLDELLAARAAGQGAAPPSIDSLLTQRANGAALSTSPGYDPSVGGNSLQIYNPFGKNLDTGINTGQGVDRFLAGAGKAFSDIGLGARQLVGSASGQDAAETRRLDAPLMNTGAGVAGNLTGAIAPAAATAFIPGANGLVGSTAVGAALGALQPAESGSERAVNTGVGGVAGAAGQKLGAMLMRPKVAPTVNQDALDIASRLGFQTTPAQQSGSKVMAQVEAKLSQQPESSGPFNAISRSNSKTLGTIAAKAIGENADNLGSPVLGAAESRIGKVFDAVADKTPVPLDPQTYAPKLAALVKDSEGMIGQNGKLSDNGLIKRLDSFISDQGGATREQLRDLSSKMGKAARSNLTSATGDRELGNYLLKAQDVVEDAIGTTLSGAQAKTYAEARSQYRTLMDLTARNTIINPSSGEVNAKALANVLMSKDKGGFTFGKNTSDLYEAARFAQAFPEVVGNSGTPTREAFSLGQVPSRLAGAVGSRAYMAGAKAYTLGQPDPVSRDVAQMLAKLLQSPAGTRLPVAGGLQGAPALSQRLVNPSEQ